MIFHQTWLQSMANEHYRWFIHSKHEIRSKPLDLENPTNHPMAKQYEGSSPTITVKSIKMRSLNMDTPITEATIRRVCENFAFEIQLATFQSNQLHFPPKIHFHWSNHINHTLSEKSQRGQVCSENRNVSPWHSSVQFTDNEERWAKGSSRTLSMCPGLSDG